MRPLLAPVFLMVLYLAATSARTLERRHWQQHAAGARQLKEAEMFGFNPLTGLKPSITLPNPVAAVTGLASRAAEGVQLPPMPAPVKPLAGLAKLLKKAESGLTAGQTMQEAPSSSESAQLMAEAVVSAKLAAAADVLSKSSASQNSMSPQASSATALGFAFNGGKAAAHASASAQDAGGSAAQASAIAIADHTAASLAQAASDASNPAHQGASAAVTKSTAIADKSALVIAKGGSTSAGLGGHLSQADTVSSSAGTGGSVAYVGGTAVASAGPGSSANTTSQATAAAEKGSVAATRADSISLGQLQGSNAQGTASANAQASNKGVAASQSLMESFGIVAGTTDATSVADATAKSGASFVRDKAVGIGLNGAAGEAHTGSTGAAGYLGLTVIDSVARAITAGQQKACAEAVTKTYSDLSTGPQISLDTFILTLQQRADNACVTSFKDQAAAHAGKAAEQQARLPTFDGIGEALSQQTKGVIKAASNAVGQVQDFVGAALEDLPVMLHKATWGATVGSKVLG